MRGVITSRPPRPAHQLDRHDAVAAKLEEVVVDADPRQPQHLGEQLAQDRLLRRPRRSMRRCRRKLRLRQRAAVELAVRRQRQTAPAPPAPPAPCSPATAAPARPKRQHASGTAAPAAADHIADQPLAAGPSVARNHNGLRHARLPQQHRLDLARLDPEPAQLDLRVRAAQKLQHAVGTPPRQVPGPVHPRTRPATAARHAGRPQTAPPSAPRASDSPAPDQPPRCKARRQHPPAQAQGQRPAHRPA